MTVTHPYFNQNKSGVKRVRELCIFFSMSAFQLKKRKQAFRQDDEPVDTWRRNTSSVWRDFAAIATVIRLVAAIRGC